jgi:hypothetical protein
MRRREVQPPRWSAKLLARALPERDRVSLLAEMAELYDRRTREWGEARARAWYRRQALSFAIRTMAIRRTDRRWSRADRGEERSTIMDRLRQDLRFALRRFARSPGFAVIAVLTLGIGIGANTAIFSVVRTVLLEPPPYEDPDRLVMVWQSWRGWEETWLSGPEVLDFREGVASFVDVGAYSTGSGNLTENGEPERVSLAQVSANVFDLLGAQLVAGRAYTEAEDVTGEDGVVVLTHGLWDQKAALGALGFHGHVGGLGEQADHVLAFAHLLDEHLGMDAPRFSDPVAQRNQDDGQQHGQQHIAAIETLFDQSFVHEATLAPQLRKFPNCKGTPRSTLRNSAMPARRMSGARQEPAPGR